MTRDPGGAGRGHDHDHQERKAYGMTLVALPTDLEPRTVLITGGTPPRTASTESAPREVGTLTVLDGELSHPGARQPQWRTPPPHRSPDGLGGGSASGPTTDREPVVVPEDPAGPSTTPAGAEYSSAGYADWRAETLGLVGLRTGGGEPTAT